MENIKAALDRVRFLTKRSVAAGDIDRSASRNFLCVKARDADTAEDALRRHLQQMILTIITIAQRNSQWFEEE